MARQRTASGGSPPSPAGMVPGATGGIPAPHAPHLKHLMRAQSSPAVAVPMSPPQPTLVEEPPIKHNFTTGKLSC